MHIIGATETWRYELHFVSKPQKWESLKKYFSNTKYELFLVNDQRDAQILFCVFISIYNSPHVSSTQCSSSGETNCINTASGNSHSIVVAKMCASRWSFTKNHYMMHGQQNLKQIMKLQIHNTTCLIRV
jgi:hypothetical protein